MSLKKGPTQDKAVKIFFMVPSPPGISPAQRFRFEHYLPVLEQRGIRYKIRSFYTMNDWEQLYLPGKVLKKAFFVFKGFLRRIVDTFRTIPYNYVYIQREATPIGPPVIEFVVRHFFRKRIIYDFDDAIWVPVSSAQNNLAYRLRWFSKVSSICKWSYKVSAGNQFLADYALQFNRNTIVMPTVVNTKQQHNTLRDQSKRYLVIGWTGTFSTLKYLQMLIPVIQKLQEKNDFTFVVIADKDPVLPLKKYRFVKWNKDTEINDLLLLNIGVMPLHETTIEKGKCGFKAIQYMALGIPPVISPVGMNTTLVAEGQDGFLAESENEWFQKLERLLADADLRTAIGSNARKKIVEQYSVDATSEKFIELFT